MKILGINHDMYITSAALIEDGKIIAAIPEERLTRRKQTREFPINAIKYCLDVAECGIDEISYIANSYNPGAHLEKFHPAFSNNRRFRGDYLYSVPDNLFKLLASRDKASDYIFQETLDILSLIERVRDLLYCQGARAVLRVVLFATVGTRELGIYQLHLSWSELIF